MREPLTSYHHVSMIVISNMKIDHKNENEIRMIFLWFSLLNFSNSSQSLVHSTHYVDFSSAVLLRNFNFQLNFNSEYFSCIFQKMPVSAVPSCCRPTESDSALHLPTRPVLLSVSLPSILPTWKISFKNELKQQARNTT